MKSKKMQSVGQGFFAMIVAAMSLAAGSAAAQQAAPTTEFHAQVQSLVPHRPEPARQDVIAHCGCDSKEGIEKYVQNLINDAQRRKITCDTAKLHVPACIAVYCSICGGHPGLVESCIKAGSDYFLNSSGFCGTQPPAGEITAASLPAR